MKKEEKVGLIERLKQKLGRESKKEKTLADELSLEEKKGLLRLAFIIGISIVCSAIFVPRIGLLAEQGKWLEVIFLGGIIIFLLYLFLSIFATYMKRYWKR